MQSVQGVAPYIAAINWGDVALINAALISALAALVTAVTGLVALFKHAKNHKNGTAHNGNGSTRSYK